MSLIQKEIQCFFKKHAISPKNCLGVAVSGGADSLCLAVNLAEWAKKNHFNLKAATVDHHLRAESQEEARRVHYEMAKIGIDHIILDWKGHKPKTRLEAMAREKRYDLLFKWCQENKITHLFLAHHQGDQAETFWAHLARGSGLNGLSCMDDTSVRLSNSYSITLCRPFLRLEKKEFEKDLNKRHILWATDSMNQDEHYERVRWRNQEKTFLNLGLSQEMIGLSTKRLQRARKALEFYTDRFFETLVDLSPFGFISIQEQAFYAIPEEIQIRVLIKAIQLIHPSTKIISLSGIEEWLQKHKKTSTLSGCILLSYQGTLYITKEVKKIEKPRSIPAHTLIQWDRFVIYSTKSAQIKLGLKKENLPSLILKSIPYLTSKDKIDVSYGNISSKELANCMNIHYKKGKAFILFMKG